MNIDVIRNIIYSNYEKKVIEILKKEGFVESIDGWWKNFIKVIIDNKTDINVYITHAEQWNHYNYISKKILKEKLTFVIAPLLTLKEYIKYFNTI